MACGFAQVPAFQTPPKLVVGIVVDQMRTDYIYRYWDNFGEGGFKRLCTNGAFLRDAHFDHVPTETGPGHASVFTGTVPSRHGVVANDMYVRATGKTLYCAAGPDTILGVGIDSVAGRKSPMNLLATTIADELERRFDGRSRTIGIAFKDRGAILPIGRTGDAAYWFGGGADGAFGTSTWYMRELPSWVQRFNGERLAASYLGRTWDPLLPRDRYHTPLPDDNPYEIPLTGADTPTLPIDLKALHKTSGSTGIIAYTPWGNTLTTDFALAAIEAEQLGADKVTDLLALSYSSPDILGHRVGPRAIELEDMYLRLDQDIARLLEELDKRVGPDAYTVFLTADHAALDVPAYLASLKGSAGYPDAAAMERGLNAELARRLRAGQVGARHDQRAGLSERFTDSHEEARCRTRAACSRGFPAHRSACRGSAHRERSLALRIHGGPAALAPARLLGASQRRCALRLSSGLLRGVWACTDQRHHARQRLELRHARAYPSLRSRHPSRQRSTAQLHHRHRPHHQHDRGPDDARCMHWLSDHRGAVALTSGFSSLSLSTSQGAGKAMLSLITWYQP
ncbi:MAG: alkaline phosphatase family protein [Flavobacteriales bacterium]|nr:alkaline phosphatase family protein [Flavobacteriales bacterium]